MSLISFSLQRGKDIVTYNNTQIGFVLLYIYPSNRLEDLALLTAEVIKNRPSNVLSATTILVPNPGMQHWLSLQLCEHLQVAMNIHCPMPTRFVWDMCRAILGDSSVPAQSPYKRETMVWRIYQLVASTEFLQSPVSSDVQLYWAKCQSATEMQQRQFSFAQQLADVFEQYLVFRPEWLLKWERNQTVHFEHIQHQHAQGWQMWFWQQLVAIQPVHPINLQAEAIKAMEFNVNKLPADIYIFAINSISPLYLGFFDALAKYINVHLFQLNPCVSYWGDAQSDLSIAKQQRAQAYNDSVIDDQLHPLLRNLGAQGRDLINLLSGLSHQEIAAFSPTQTSSHTAEAETLSLLQIIQHDILQGEPSMVSKTLDTSIQIHACHSEVRELQVLKDAILEKLAQHPSWQPKDILVMCPSIEKYSPYIRAIFTNSSEKHTRLPVSISDRKPIESEPLIVGFLKILKMNASRFDASSIIDLISIQSIAEKFDLSVSDLDYCALCIKHAGVSWGIDQDHQQSIIHGHTINNQHTWQWGIKRILRGILNAPNDILVADSANLGFLEGKNTEILGRFFTCLEQLEITLSNLLEERSLVEWAAYLQKTLHNLFIPSNDDALALQLLQGAIVKLGDAQETAHCQLPIGVDIIASAIESQLNIPETRSQFHAGNITFCSMLPMRSIPFKMIAILGLNQSDFPRQDTPFEINLIQGAPSKLGDRSRRGDDRYLFLESLVSAREYLHLSYQYRKVNDNAQREPSLMLQMLIDYCHQHYSQDCLAIVEHPLQSFSPLAFMSNGAHKGSYNLAWWQQTQALISEAPIPTDATHEHSGANTNLQSLQHVNTGALARFLKDSLAYYAKNTLSVYLDPIELRDFEQQYSINKLTEYRFRYDVMNSVKHDTSHTSLNTIVEYWQASGELPFLVGLHDTLDEYKREALLLAAIQSSIVDNGERFVGELSLQNSAIEFDVLANLDIGVQDLKLTPGAPSFKHMLEIWIHYLVLRQHIEHSPQTFSAYSPDTFHAGVYFLQPNKNDDEPPLLMYAKYILPAHITPAKALNDLMNTYISGCQSPLLLDHGLATEIVKFSSVEEALTSRELNLTWREAGEEKSEKASIGKNLPNPYFD
ncbi:MAG: exodeoxyribonuclease V subunit gamma, partial [Glaciecola sp.]